MDQQQDTPNGEPDHDHAEPILFMDDWDTADTVMEEGIEVDGVRKSQTLMTMSIPSLCLSMRTKSIHRTSNEQWSSRSTPSIDRV